MATRRRRLKKPEYKIDMVKQQTSRARWEYWREHGIEPEPGMEILKKEDLDAYTDERIHEQRYPDKPKQRIIK